MRAGVPGCPFCAIVDHSELADLVYEDDSVICFLPKVLNAYGHTLIAPKAHYETVWSIDRAVLTQLMVVVQELSRHYRSHLAATGFNLLHASGPDAQQSILHFHLHLLPRFAADGLDGWPHLPVVEVNRLELVTRLQLPQPF
jgi:histidine triad (HIT) family protein